MFKGDTGEHHTELSTKRFGMSETVAATIRKFEALAKRNEFVGSIELAGLIELIQRRNDRKLILVDAGRRSAEYILSSKRTVAARAPAVVSGRLGYAAVRRIAKKFFSLSLDGGGEGFEFRAPEVDGVDGEIRVGFCDIHGSAATVLLERLAGFEGALEHTSCLGRGEGCCSWKASSREESD